MFSSGAFGLALSTVGSSAPHLELAPPTAEAQKAVRSRASISVHCDLSRNKHGVGDVL